MQGWELVPIEKKTGQNLIGHIMEHGHLVKTIVGLGQVEGKNGRGRPQMKYTGQVMMRCQVRT